MAGGIDLEMPIERFGVFNDGRQPADVFGFVLRKPDRQIEEEYGAAPSVEAWRVAFLRDTYPPEWPDDLLSPA